MSKSTKDSQTDKTEAAAVAASAKITPIAVLWCRTHKITASKGPGHCVALCRHGDKVRVEGPTELSNLSVIASKWHGKSFVGRPDRFASLLGGVPVIRGSEAINKFVKDQNLTDKLPELLVAVGS